MNEILNCIKLIKMYAWEKPFAKAVSGMCIFVINTLLSLIIKTTSFSCIIISKEAITTAVKNTESFFVEKKLLPSVTVEWFSTQILVNFDIFKLSFFLQYNFIEHVHVQLTFTKKNATKRKLQLEADKKVT